MEKAMAPHSSTLAWETPSTEEPGGLQPMGSLRVGHDWATSLWLFTFMHWRRKWQPTSVLLPGESQGRGSLWAAIYGVAQSRTWLKRLSSSIKWLNILQCTGQLPTEVGTEREVQSMCWNGEILNYRTWLLTHSPLRCPSSVTHPSHLSFIS